MLKQLGPTKRKSKVKVLFVPMALRAVPISVSVAVGHTSANAVKATAGGRTTGSSACLSFPVKFREVL